jgi:hypothetical protein
MDLSIYDPTPLDFNAPPPPPYTRAEWREEGYSDDDVNWLMTMGLLAKPTGHFTKLREDQGGKVTGMGESWAFADVQNFFENRTRILGNRK